MSGELQGEDEPGEDGMQHMWVSNTPGPTMPGRSLVPSDMCASESLKINIFYTFSKPGGHRKTPPPTVFYGYFSSWNTFKWGKKTASNVFSHAEENSPSFSFSMGQRYILQETEGWKRGVKGSFSK